MRGCQEDCDRADRSPAATTLEWLSVKELALYLNLKPKTVYHLVETASIPHYRVGRVVRFRREEVDAWMESKRIKADSVDVDKILASFYTPTEGRPSHL